MINSKEKRHITVVGRGGSGGMSEVNWDDIQNKPDFAEVATSGDYNDLENKPQLATVATSGSYNDLTDKPTILTQWFGTQAEYDAIAVKDPNVIYNIEGSDNVQADWNQSDSSADDYIKNKPTIPAAQVNADWNANSGVAQILNKPTIPAAQVNSDWNANSGVAQILNKPNLATVATTGSYNDLSDKPTVTQEQADWNQTDNAQVDFIKNKPTIPTVPAMDIEELTFTLEGGTVKTVQFYVKPTGYFYVEDTSGSNNTLTIHSGDRAPHNIELFKSTDLDNWESMGIINNAHYLTATVAPNSKLYLKANCDTWSLANGTLENQTNNIIMSKSFKVGGYLTSLIYGDNYKNLDISNKANCFGYLFNNATNLQSAENLILPTTLANSCYQFMFYGCTSLTTAPTLPETTLTDSCYQFMFYDCTSLTTAPALPATTLTRSCYQRMFYGCTSLTTAPALPATTLTESCYAQMFNGCTSLATAPELPATTLTKYCYSNMFNGCTNIDSVTTYAQDISASGCLTNWLNNVAATGDFYNLGSATYTSGASGIPSGWTEHTSL